MQNTKKELLKNWLREQKVVKTSDVIRFGLQNYYTRAERTARELAEEGYIRRIDESTKQEHYGNIKEEVWVTV